MLPDETGQGVGGGGLRLFEGVYQPQVRLGRWHCPLGGPGEELVQRTLGPGVYLAQQVAVRPAVAVAELDHLVDGVGHGPGGIPPGDGPAQTPAPAAHGVGVPRELVQMAAGAGTRGSASKAIALVSTSPWDAARARANRAGPTLGARRSSLTATISRTAARPPESTQRRTAWAFSRVSFLSEA